MTIERYEDGSGITQEHLLTRERQFKEMKRIEDFFDVRYGIRSVDRADLVIDSDRNIILKYEKIRSSAKPRRKLGYLEFTVGKVRVRSEQVMHLGGDHGVQYDPYISYDDPDLGRPLKNTRETITAVNQLLDSVFPEEK